MPRSILRRILLPFAAALPLVALVAGTTLANPPMSRVSVYNEDGSPAGATVCEFYMMFGPVTGGESGVWEIQTESGTVVRSGDYSVTATQGDREPSVGDIPLPNATYVLLWDNEAAIDASHGELTITVACAAASPSPSPSMAPSEAPSGAPSTAPSQAPSMAPSEAPSTPPSVVPSASVEASPVAPSPSDITTGGGEMPSASPTGEVAGITTTPPPTDTGTPTSGSSPIVALALVLLGIAAASIATLPVARVIVRRR